MITFVATFIIFVLSIYYLIFRVRPKNFPPGPIPLPVVGSLHLTKDKPHLAMSELSNKYGPIVGLKFGSEWSIWLHETSLIREAYNEGVFSGRFESEASWFLTGGTNGILQATGEVWTEQRRFATRTLRDFGFGRASMEDMIIDEAQELCDWLKKQNGAPVELFRRFSLAVVNSLWSILTGERFDHDDKYLLRILNQLESTQRQLLSFTSPLKVALLFFYPKVSKFFSKYTGWDELVECTKSKNEMFERIITEHHETLAEESPRDFVDVYLREVNKTVSKGSSFHPSTGKNSLRSVLSDMFLAGSDTTSVTLNWTILYLVHHPKVQEKIHEELDRVVGKTRNPNLSDRQNMPYTEAMIMEVLRKSSILPIAVSHMAQDDVVFHGYDIPKGTIIHANVHHVHHDPAIWGDPEAFRPERFLNADGSCMQRHESLIPFSVGRRVCMGESLARDSLFLFISILLLNFTVTIDPDADTPTLEPQFGQITVQPKKFEVSMKYRN